MTTLWTGIGLLVVLALAFVIVPAWRAGASDPAARRWASLGVLVLLPLATAGLYRHLGAPAIIEEQALTRAQSRYDVDGMLQALENKLKTRPDDPQGWFALGRAYIALQRYADAEEALRKANDQSPNDARLLAQYAEAIGLRQGHLDGRPAELLAQALEINHDEEKALELAGLAAFKQERWAEALHHWRRLLKRLPTTTEQHEAIAEAVRTAERRLDLGLGGSGMPITPVNADPSRK